MVKRWGVIFGNRRLNPVASVPKLIMEPIGNMPILFEWRILKILKKMWMKWNI